MATRRGNRVCVAMGERYCNPCCAVSRRFAKTKSVENPTGAVLWLSDLLPIDKLVSICQKIYFPLNTCSEAEFILANACLCWLCIDCGIATEDEALRAEYRRHSMDSRKKLQAAFSQIRLVSVPTTEVIAALVVGVIRRVSLVHFN